MKMSDYFTLPVMPDIGFDDHKVKVCNMLNLLDDQAESACSAINNHDKLVETVKTLLEIMASADARDYAKAVRSARELIDGLE